MPTTLAPFALAWMINGSDGITVSSGMAVGGGAMLIIIVQIIMGQKKQRWWHRLFCACSSNDSVTSSDYDTFEQAQRAASNVAVFYNSGHPVDPHIRRKIRRAYDRESQRHIDFSRKK